MAGWRFLFGAGLPRAPIVQPQPIHRIRKLSVRASSSCLVDVFNRPKPFSSGIPNGLLGNPLLASPQGLGVFAEQAHARCQVLVKEMLDMPENAWDVSRSPIHVLDDMSDTLCQVLDFGEMLRQLHHDEVYRAAAEESCARLGHFLEELNSHEGMYTTLVNFMDSEEFQGLSVEAQRTAEVFRVDFETSGISLPEELKEETVIETMAIEKLKIDFESATFDIGGVAVIPTDKLSGVPSNVKSQIYQRDQQFYIPCQNRYIVAAVLGTASDPEVRKQVLRASFAHCETATNLLTELVRRRHQAAKSIGYGSYAEKAMERGPMAGNVETVTEFLSSVADQIQDGVLDEMAELQELAQVNAQVRQLTSADVAFCKKLAKKTNRATDAVREEDFFSIGGCLKGLDVITRRLFGISLEPVDVAPGEVWGEGIQKLEVVHEEEGLLGVLYCDFWARSGKNSHPSHYNIRSGRTLPDGSYQTPIVGLVCGFRQATLVFGEVETLFHEAGHALHSMLGRANFQNVAGTRCPLDFTELPSTLMEFFVRDYRIVSLFAKHKDTGKAISAEEFQVCLDHHLEFNSLSQERSLLLAAFDFHLHMDGLQTKEAIEVLKQVHDRYCQMPFDGNPTFATFAHLSGYGASYYSYLWCRALAGLIWHQCFHEDPLCRSAGERYREYILKPGNGADPWVMVSRLLGYSPTITQLTASFATKHQ